MDNKKVFLGAALAMVCFLIYQAYIDFQNRKLSENNTQIQSQIISKNSNNPNPNLNSAATNSNNDLPTIDDNNELVRESTTNQMNKNDSDFILVETPEYEIYLSKVGGSIVQLGLKKFPVSVEQPDQPFLLLKNEQTDRFLANSGLLSKQINLPNHTDKFTSQTNHYQMNGNQLVVPLIFENDEVKVVKKYTFNSDSYLIKISYDVTNKTDESFEMLDYAQFNRYYIAKGGSFLMMPSYVGGAAFLNDKYVKIDFEDMKVEPLNDQSTEGWVAITQHYFFSAWIPEKEKISAFYSKGLSDGSVNLGYKSAALVQVEPNQELKEVAKVKLFAGSKDNKTLVNLSPASNTDTDYVAKKLYLTADYGWLAFLARPLFSYMQWIFSWVNSWPLTIVLLVLTIKLVFYKLSEKSYRSMATMRKLSPRLTAIKERCGDDKASFQKEMMALYKNEKVNPMSGCFPILIQIPVFISLYWVLLESVEMRQEPFLWIADLSLADPFYILPIIMAITMFVQFKLNPKPADPTQAKVMMFMPIVFSVLFIFFPAALVFYWVVNNIFSILQQYIITKRVEEKLG